MSVERPEGCRATSALPIDSMVVNANSAEGTRAPAGEGAAAARTYSLGRFSNRRSAELSAPPPPP